MLLLLIPAVLIAVVAAIVAHQAYRAQRRVLDARQWVRTSGLIIYSGVREQLVRQPESIGSGYRMATRYAPHIVYRYTVNQADYQAERLTLGTTLLHSEEADAARDAARYQVGRMVTVYYDPDDPADATLNPRTGMGTMILWGVALLLLGCALYVAGQAIAPWLRGL
ncbi:MAG: DUF3592 domain-containing protein [Chloroflexi bacterium]|nr:DUF3592 domain-containing protein [Chloroflexota bacterium]